MISTDHVWLWIQLFNSVCNVFRNTSIENEICPLDFNSWDVYILGLVYICFNVSFKMQAPMHFMQLMCLHFIFLYFVDDHGDVAMESASVGKGIEKSFNEKMFFCICFIPTRCILRVVLTLKLIISMMINGCLKCLHFFNVFDGM